MKRLASLLLALTLGSASLLGQADLDCLPASGTPGTFVYDYADILSPEDEAEFNQTVRALNDTTPNSIVVVTHELDSAFKIADRITILDRGDILMIGTVEEVLNAKNDRVQALLNRTPEEDTMDPDDYLNRLVGEENPGTAHL